jgi:hypothetical protein
MNELIEIKCAVFGSENNKYDQKISIDIDGDELYIHLNSDVDSMWFKLTKRQCELLSSVLKTISKTIE